MSESFLMLVLLGFGIGTIGTLIGAGGGFILVPVLILFYPNLDTQSITAISMALVAANALSGSFSYVRSGRVDYKTAVVFALATLPGSVLGVLATEIIPRYFFDLIFGVVLIMLSLFLFFKGGQKREYAIHKKTAGQTYRNITDKYGETFGYSYNMKYGIILSVFVGFFSPLLGIGGGIIHVPALVEWFQFPPHIATATSHFILAIMTVVSVTVHYFEGSYADTKVIEMIIPLISGVVPGSFLGARLSRKVKGRFIIKTLAVALGIVGIRIFLSAF